MACRRYGEAYARKKVKTQKELVEDAIVSLEVFKKKENLNVNHIKDDLLSFPGAGVLKEAGIFNPNQDACPRWVQDAQRKIKSLTTTEEWSSLQNSGMLNSHYTSHNVIRIMWEYLGQFLHSRNCVSIGEPGDVVLDPGCGTGAFLTHKPYNLRVQYVGVEKCPVACAIAKKAHSLLDANFYEADFTNWDYPMMFDGIIGNVPFCNGSDWLKYQGEKFNIGLHAQFIFLASLKLKPGGVMALLTSTSTLDARGKDYLALRDHLARRCELLKAIRLPSDGGIHIGETQVTTDLIILQKRKHPIESSCNAGWIHSIDSGLTPPSGNDPVYINEWFLNNPACLVGIPGVNQLRGKNGNPAYNFALSKDGDVLGKLSSVLLSKQEKTMTATTNTSGMTNTSSNAWQAFEIKYVDKKGAVPGCEAIQLHFPEKPPKSICEALGKVQFIYHSNGTKYWYAYITPNIEKWTLNTLLKKYAPMGAKITAPKVGEKEVAASTQQKGKVGISDLVSLMQEMSAAVKDIQQQTDATREEMCEMRSHIEGNMFSVDTEKYKELEHLVQFKDSEIKVEKQKIMELETQLKLLTEERLQLQQEVRDLKKDKNDLTKELAASNATSSEVQSKVEELEATVVQMRAQIEEWGLDENDDDEFPSLEDDDGFPSLEDDEELFQPSPSAIETDSEEVNLTWDELEEPKNV